jgi:hypothetical protein
MEKLIAEERNRDEVIRNNIISKSNLSASIEQPPRFANE